MKKIGFSKYQVGAMVALPVAIMLNPLTLEIYLDLVKLVLEVISFIAGAYFVGYTLVRLFTPQQPRLPAKGKGHSKDGMKYEAVKASKV